MKVLPICCRPVTGRANNTNFKNCLKEVFILGSDVLPDALAVFRDNKAALGALDLLGPSIKDPLVAGCVERAAVTGTVDPLRQALGLLSGISSDTRESALRLLI